MLSTILPFPAVAVGPYLAREVARARTTGHADIRRASVADADLHLAAAQWARTPDSREPNLVGGWS